MHILLCITEVYIRLRTCEGRKWLRFNVPLDK